MQNGNKTTYFILIERKQETLFTMVTTVTTVTMVFMVDGNHGYLPLDGLPIVEQA